MPSSSRVIRVRALPEIPFCYRYSAAPYRGCAHACRYCDGRAEKYYVEGDFDSDIVIRKTLPDQLAEELGRLRERGLFSLGSGTSDSWQPAERHTGLTRRILQILAEGNLPVTAITKSSLILRDLDLISQIHNRNGMLVFITVTSLDDQIREIFEPGASASFERMEVVRGLSGAGIPVVALVMPLLPGLTDQDPVLEKLYTELKQAGVCAIIPGHLTLRPGRQKEHFLATLQEHFPDLVPLYDTLYGEERLSGNPVLTYRKTLYRKTMDLADRLALPFAVPHPVFAPLVSRCDAVMILLEQMELLYTIRGVDVSALKAATNRYRDWLLNLRRDFSRRRSLSEDYPDQVLLDFATSGNLTDLLGNEKLARYLCRVLLEGSFWDNLTGKWY